MANPFIFNTMFVMLEDIVLGILLSTNFCKTFVLSKSKKPGIIIREQVVAVSHVESLDFNKKVSQPVVTGAVVRLTGMGIDLRLGIPKSYRAKNG